MHRGGGEEGHVGRAEEGHVGRGEEGARGGSNPFKSPGRRSRSS